MINSAVGIAGLTVGGLLWLALIVELFGNVVVRLRVRHLRAAPVPDEGVDRA
ncbi:MAG TPA: hypothetical protein VGM70_08880 [Pseudolysinimonas sp.]